MDKRIGKHIYLTEPKIVRRGWGTEIWIANMSKYCGKILLLNEECCCSYHYHRVKDETFYILEGEVEMDVDGKTITLTEGEAIHIVPYTPHRFYGVKQSKIMEVSTEHFEEDSYRIIHSGKCDDVDPDVVTQDDVIRYEQKIASNMRVYDEC